MQPWEGVSAIWHTGKVALVEPMSISPGKDLRRESRLSLGFKRSHCLLRPRPYRTAGTMIVVPNPVSRLEVHQVAMRGNDLRACSLADAELNTTKLIRSTFGQRNALRYLCAAALAGSAATRALLAAMSALRFSAIWRCFSANGGNGPYRCWSAVAPSM